MRRFWRRLSLQFTRDDLFLRVLAFCFGGVFAAVGFFILSFVNESRDYGVGYTIFAIVFGGVSALLGLLVLSRCIAPANSRWARISEKGLDGGPSDLGELALVLVLFVLVPGLITIALRNIGVRGQRQFQKKTDDTSPETKSG